MSELIKKKKKHVTFRLDLDICNALELEAEKQGLSITTLMGQITKNYVLIDKFFKELGFLPLGKEFVRVWLEKIENVDIKKDAQKLGKALIREYLAYFFHKIDVNSLIKFLELWLRSQGKLQQKNHMNVYYYTIHHNVSEKYSLFLEGFLFSEIESITNTRVDLIESTSNLISFTFEVK